MEPVILIRQEDATHELLAATDYCIGIEEKRIYTHRWITVHPDDLLLFYTDGLTEAEAPGGEFFGRERVLEILRAKQENGTSDILKEILNALKRFLGEKTLSDELSLLLIKF
ncbi:MAG: PP2C family protein-serine/threonine phosphatase [Acidobacteriota bacterium]